MSDILGCTVDYNIAYTEDPNFLIFDIVDSAAECAQYAKSIGGALFWSWVPQHKFCCPKTSDSGRVAGSGITSGTVACGSAGGAGKHFFFFV